MSGGFDLVTVPDFLGKRSLDFEARTLFLLGSWLERREALNRWPLHLACIGTPPDSVAWLAEIAGARVTVHEPLGLPHKEGFINKLRGLEAGGDAPAVFLIDTDMFLLGSLDPLEQLTGSLAAAREVKPRVPEHLWLRLYAFLGMRPPETRIASVFGEIGRYPRFLKHFPEQKAECRAMMPYFNAGALLVPRGSGLLKLWRERMALVAEFAEGLEEPYRSWTEFSGCDQTALATVVETLRREGAPFSALPDEYNCFDVHLIYRRMALGQARVFHATAFCKGLRDERGAVTRGVEKWSDRCLDRSLECLAWFQHPRTAWRLALANRALAADFRELRNFTKRLLQRHVGEALRHTGRGALV